MNTKTFTTNVKFMIFNVITAPTFITSAIDIDLLLEVIEIEKIVRSRLRFGVDQEIQWRFVHDFPDGFGGIGTGCDEF